MLLGEGYEPYGKEKLFHPHTGEPFAEPVFIGRWPTSGWLYWRRQGKGRVYLRVVS